MAFSFSDTPKMMVPESVFNSIKQTYNLDIAEAQPELVDLFLELKNSSGNTKIPIGYSQEVVDLAQYVNRKDPRVTWQISSDFKFDEGSTVYFLSRYKPAVSSTGKTIGYECGSAYKIQSKTNRIINAGFNTLMAQNGHYMSMIGGDYLVLHLEGKKLKMSYFKIRDSRWTHQLCTLDY
jgi:hypothetical protein